ncbi:DNA-binding CsgD family transcriptional regulator [Rubrivivax gelatinosus]|uniref:DNA-binding CsgD family transcriptional regulator n=2 Tax=Rubrivivax gelatinosus TaxID=28068 RepID=A0A4R2M7N5_RUBGE|nr:DNA-binding CsgD family transcriptional regulator [Rubrivivax gelatinosus]
MTERTPTGGWARCLGLMLDEIDYGLLLLDANGIVRWRNDRAQAELDDAHPLQISAGHLGAQLPEDAARLAAAVADAAQRGTREMLTLGAGRQRVTLAVVPLAPDALDGHPATMLLLGKRQVCEDLSVRGFARAHRLTPAETRVLEALCAGVAPQKFAEHQGVRISTVRTQIGSIREKTGARSIRSLVRMVALLPPMVPALRGVVFEPMERWPLERTTDAA